MEYEIISKYKSAKEAVLRTREIENDKIRLTINKRIVEVLKSMKKRNATKGEKQIALEVLTYSLQSQKRN